MKIFLTGGTGFVGSHIINVALARGHSIVGLRRPGSTPRIEVASQPNWVFGDLDTPISSAMDGCDLFLHAAAHSPNTPYDTLENCVYWNVLSSLRLVRAAAERGVRRFLFVGSCFEYGQSADRYDKIPPDAPLLPLGSYPTSKAMATLGFREFARETGITGTIARLFQVYGEGEAESRFWQSLKAAAQAGRDFALSPGEQVRDFIHVSDAATQLVALAEKVEQTEDAGLSEVNVATGNPRQLRVFAEELWRQWNAPGKLLCGAVAYKPNEVMRIVAQL